MKKLIILGCTAGLVLFASCGNNTDNKENQNIVPAPENIPPGNSTYDPMVRDSLRANDSISTNTDTNRRTSPDTTINRN